MIKLQNLSFGSARSPILEDISLTLQKGMITVIVGPNGAGKSTLMRLMAGILKPTKGTISLVEGSHVLQISNTRGQLHSAHQTLAKLLSWYGDPSPILFPFSAFELVLMGRFPHHQGWPSIEDRIFAEKCLLDLEMKHLAKRSVLELSSGELQKVMLARALCNHPKLLLLDEPTSHLDPSGSLRFERLLHQKKADGMTIILILHDLAQAIRIADSLVIMQAGKIKAHIEKLSELSLPSNMRTNKEEELKLFLEDAFRISMEWVHSNGRSIPIFSALID